MITEDFSRDISEFENLLSKIAADLAGEVISERLPPQEVWNRLEGSVTSLQNLAEKTMKTMLLLKPEKTMAIDGRFIAVSTTLNAFKEALFQRTADPRSNVRLALEHLRKSVSEGTEFLRLAKDVESQPSELIAEVLKLKEVYGAKDYLSAVLLPQTVHARFMVLKQQFENLKLHMSNLEKAFEEMRGHMDIVEEEIRKFYPSQTSTAEEPEKKEGGTGDKTTQP